jgi:hypothetical protein
MKSGRLGIILCAALAWPGMAEAAKKDASGCNVVAAGMNRGAASEPWKMRVTIRSNDRGSDYHCDRVEVVGEDGKVIATHRIEKSHEGEQPFVVEFTFAAIPPGMATIQVRALMKPTGESGRVSKLKVPGVRKTN